MRKRGRSFARRVDPHAALHTIAMQHGLDTSQQNDLGVAMRVSLEALRTGRATEQEFHTLAAAVNVSLVLCERNAGAEYMGHVKNAQDALLRLWDRGKKTGRWVLDGPGYAAISGAVELHEAQLAAVPRSAAAEAMREVKRRIERGDVFDTTTEEAA